MGLTHIDPEGNAVMVDVTEKSITSRRAVARGSIRMSVDCFAAVRDGTAQKGDVLGVAQVAGILAAKKAADLIPLCHRLNLTGVSLRFSLLPDTREVVAVCTVRCDGKTGAEMEALTGVSVSLLTVYDMCKALDQSMVMGEIHLVEKEGGKSGHFHFAPEGLSE